MGGLSREMFGGKDIEVGGRKLELEVFWAALIQSQ